MKSQVVLYNERRALMQSVFRCTATSTFFLYTLWQDKSFVCIYKNSCSACSQVIAQQFSTMLLFFMNQALCIHCKSQCIISIAHARRRENVQIYNSFLPQLHFTSNTLKTLIVLQIITSTAIHYQFHSISNSAPER